ncbi:hypothetical protein [Streptomyces sp. NPDC012510]|uniref:hypothetical protein n=1 Tax=Streptomyces sp. NPDC012510 TaxID=3364838 RepID=UPI0036EDF342
MSRRPRRRRAPMERRRPLYAEVARVAVDVRERTPAETVDSVLTVPGLGLA